MKTTTALASLLLAILVIGLQAAPIWAEPLDSEIILKASDGSEGDNLGQAVAISGSIAIVGADTDDDAGKNSGSAYLFDASTGNELFKLTASDAAPGDLFGHSVAISGNTAIVSAARNSDAGNFSGSVYVFDVTTGAELLKLTASDAAAGDRFGHGLAISDDRIIVGSYHDDDAGSSSGSAYIFDTTTGDELMKLTASDGAAGDQFGYWTAISGNIAIVGSKYDDDAGTDSGSAYLFDITTGDELFKLTASDGAAGDYFGYAVSIDGNMAVVGAYNDDDVGANSGAVYVFDVNTGRELHKLTASDGAAGDEFGRAFGISGYTVAVGSENNDALGNNSGAAYIYDLTFGDELGKLTASDAAAFDGFGTAVGMNGNLALVGAWLADDPNAANVGRAYAFDISTLLPPGADFNNDGVVDALDLSIWERSSPIPRLDVDEDDQVDGKDFLLWQQGFHTELLFDESPANLDQQGPVGEADLSIWQQSFGVDGLGDTDNDGDSDGADFLAWQRDFTPFDAADENLDRRVDGLDLEYWHTSFGWDADLDGDGHLDGDADGDGIVSERDFLWWQIHFENTSPTIDYVQVPESASCILFTELMVACIIGCRPRSRQIERT